MEKAEMKKNLLGTFEEDADKTRAEVSDYAWSRTAGAHLDEKAWHKEFSKHMVERSAKLFGTLKKPRG